MRRGRFQLIALAIATLGAGCAVGPTPRDASNGEDVSIHNTAAVVANSHATLDVDDSPFALGVLAQADRDPRDRALDARYQGGDLLTFLGVHPGMRVLELTAGGGYMTELFARSVGPTGEVFANDPPSLLGLVAGGGRERGTGAAMKSALRERLARPANARVTLLDDELATAAPERARGVDLVYLSLPFRTADALGVNIAAMNRAAFDALAPGGTLVVLDFRPRVPGPVPLDLHALHREESSNVRLRLEASGFRFVAEGRFLHNDPSPNEWDAVHADRPTALEEQDRFLLKFVKP